MFSTQSLWVKFRLGHRRRREPRPVAIGTETDGSIVSPHPSTLFVGIKPTVGLISRAGIIPISHSQDTVGPMTRSVRDAAILLGALAGVDPRDPATESSRDRAHADYTRFLDANGLRGARIGVARRFFRSSLVGLKVLEVAIEEMKSCGAEIIDLPTGGFLKSPPRPSTR